MNPNCDVERLLQEWCDEETEPCRVNVDGNCQEHYLQPVRQCVVLRARLAVGEIPKIEAWS